MATVLPLRTAWIVDVFRKCPCAMYKDNAVGTVIAETGRDCGNTTRLSDFNAVSALCVAVERRGSTLTHSSARSAAADSE